MNIEIKELIQRRRRQILVHSFLYYQLNENIITDHIFDMWCKELVELQKQYKDESSSAALYEAFKTFDGSSGYDLPYTNPDIQNVGYRLLRHHKTI